MMAVAALERDAELMLRVREGDSASFALLLERHRGPVIHFLYRMVLNQAVAEELAQEVFLRVYRSRASTSQRRDSRRGSSGLRRTLLSTTFATDGTKKDRKASIRTFAKGWPGSCPVRN